MTTHFNNDTGQMSRVSGDGAGMRLGHYNLVVIGATPGGVACAVRAAREGLSVLLVEPSRHVGGMWASGLQGFDTRYAGHRCPILSEFLGRLQEHYRSTFGDGSPEHAMACFGNAERHGERPRFEAWVAEKVFREMLDEQRRVRLLPGYRIGQVRLEERQIREVVLETDVPGQGSVCATGDVFADATYEADLAAAAGAPYRVGREGRAEFGEPHAGRYLTTIEPIGERGAIIAKDLDLHFFNRTSRKKFPGSTGESDAAVQAYTLRLTLTDVPANRRPISRPPGYDRNLFLGILDRSPEAHDKGYPLSSHYLHGEISHLRLAATLPNRKTDWLGANFVGRNHAYPDAEPALRRTIYEEHVAHALGTMYFLQNDTAVPAGVRADYGRWGLARDEYTDTGNIPWMMYVREARRLRGLHIFTEHDASRHPCHARTPIHADSVAFAEWPMDSHDCNPVRAPGSFNDGEFILAEETLPAQIPYRCLLTDAVENLLVPVCLSSTHVGWGTLRLEPVFVHTGEAAGVAAAICLRDNVQPRRLDGACLQGELLKRRIAVSYFADLELGDENEEVRDLQFLGARGFFGGYAARPYGTTGEARAAAWQEIARGLLGGATDLNAFAALARRAEVPGIGPSEPDAAPGWGAGVLSGASSLELRPDETVAQAARKVCDVLQTVAKAGLSV